MKNTDKSLVEVLNDSTAIMDRKKVNAKLKELRKAYKKGDNAKLEELSKDFIEISNCLGNEDESAINKNIDSINKEIEKNGASALNIARLNNNKAKLALLKDRPIIQEAAANDGYGTLEKKETDKKAGLVIGGAFASLLSITACYVFAVNQLSKDSNKQSLTDSETTTTLGASNNDPTETNSQATENEIYESTISTSESYVIERIDTDYSAPTRATTVATTGSDGNTYSTVAPDATITTIRPTTDPDTVTVVTPPTTSSTTGTNATSSTTSTTSSTSSTTGTSATSGTSSTTTTPETSAVPTNGSGVIVDDNNDPVPTTSYIEPTGTDTLPVEPTHETLAPSDYIEEDEEIEIVVEVPVETLDPNDPANVKELSVYKGTVKVLILR